MNKLKNIVAFCILSAIAYACGGSDSTAADVFDN